MLLRYLFLAALLSLSSLAAHSEIFSAQRNNPLFSDEAKDSEDHRLAKVKDDFFLLLSIPIAKRTFENFLLPWIRIRSELASILNASQQKSEPIESVIQEADPNDCFSTAITDLLAKYSGKSLNPYQKHLLTKMQSEPRLGIFFFDEKPPCARKEQYTKGSPSILNCSIQSSDPVILNETINGIIETAPDVVCIQNVANEEVRYNLYEKLRESYDCFCIEDELEGRPNHSTLIASKYYLDSDQDSFLDKSGVFFYLNIIANDNEIGHILMARPNRADSLEKLDESVKKVTDRIVEKFLASSGPTILFGNFSYETPPSDAFKSFMDCFFQNDENDEKVCTLLFRSHELIPKSIVSIPLSSTQRGLKYSCFADYLTPCREKRYQGQVVLACNGHANASGDIDSHGNSHGEVSIGVSGNGWSAEVYGGGGYDRDGHGSCEAGARMSFDW
jgi:hypothetical protein